MKIAWIDMTSIALPNGGRCINQIRLRAEPAVPEGPLTNGHATPDMVRFNKCDIAAATGYTPIDSGAPAPEDLVGLPTNILSWQVE